MVLKNKLIESISIEQEIEIVDYMHPLVDLLTLESLLQPFDYLSSILLILTKVIKGVKSDVIELEDLYSEQLKCADKFFRHHTSNLKAFISYGESDTPYVRQKHYYWNGGDIPVTFADIYRALNEGTNGDLSRDINTPLFKLILIGIHMCYEYYGHSKQLEDDINELFYKYDREIISYRKKLNK